MMEEEKKVKGWIDMIDYFLEKSTIKESKEYGTALISLKDYLIARPDPKDDEVIVQMSKEMWNEYNRSAAIIKQLREENESLKSKLKFQKILDRINNFFKKIFRIKKIINFTQN